MSLTVDLNSDLGEGAEFDSEILDVVTSANISCAFHAGDPSSVLATIRDAQEKNVSIGAHPSFLDHKNFGRTEMKISPAEVFALLVYQLGAFNALTTSAGARMSHVKAHGALYNMAARDRELATAVVEAVVMIDPYLNLFAPSHGALTEVAMAAELPVVREVFADRNYLNDGALVPRTRGDAMLTNPEEAAKRVVRMLREGKVTSVEGHEIEVQAETICVHGDTPGAVDFVRHLRVELELQGVVICAPKTAL